MTQPADGTGQSAGAGGQSATGTEGTAGTTDTGTGTQSGAQTGTPEATVSRAEFEALQRQLSAADQKRNEAERVAKELRDKQLSAEEKTKQDLEEAQKALAQREADLKAARIQAAFLTDNSFNWHDPKAALRLADLSGVTIDGDKVSGLKEALKAVADAFPFMVKPKEDNNSGGSGTTETAGGATGVGGQGAGNSRTGSTTKQELEKKFTALRGRVS